MQYGKQVAHMDWTGCDLFLRRINAAVQALGSSVPNAS